MDSHFIADQLRQPVEFALLDSGRYNFFVTAKDGKVRFQRVGDGLPEDFCQSISGSVTGAREFEAGRYRFVPQTGAEFSVSITPEGE